MNRATTTHGVAEHPPEPQPPIWLSIRETSSYLGVGTRLVRRLVREGRLPARRLHGAAHIPKSAIDDLLERGPRGPPRHP